MAHEGIHTRRPQTASTGILGPSLDVPVQPVAMLCSAHDLEQLAMSYMNTSDATPGIHRALHVTPQTSAMVKRFYEALVSGKEFQDDSWKAWATYHPADVQAADAQVCLI